MFSFYLLNIYSNKPTPIPEPVSWLLDHLNHPMLKRANARLQASMDAPDPQRILRVVVRRCGLNLIEIHEQRIIVHYWGKTGLGDLRPFFKEKQLAKSNMEVVLIDRKRETMVFHSTDDFLYGDKVAEGFPWSMYQQRWQQRDTQESDDWTAAPRSYANYSWERLSARQIPWAVLKCAWQQQECPKCANCDLPLVVLSFSWWKGALRYRWICFECQRIFEQAPKAWVWQRLSRFLDEPLLPIKIHWWGTSDLRSATAKRRAVARIAEIEESFD